MFTFNTKDGIFVNNGPLFGHLRKVGGRDIARMSSARVSRSQTLTSLFTGRIRRGCSSGAGRQGRHEDGGEGRDGMLFHC